MAITVEPIELQRLARSAGFSSVDEVEAVLVQGGLPLSKFAARFGRPISEISVAPGAERQAAVLESMRREVKELEAELEDAYARGRSRRALSLETDLDAAYDRMEAVAAQLEEGGEETMVGEFTSGDVFERQLGEYYYMATQHPMYARAEQHASGEALQHFIRHETGRRVSKEKAMEMGRAAFEARLARIRRMQERLAASERSGRVPEHVRVAHELARLRASRVPPELAEALGYPPATLHPNAPTHPVLEATVEALRSGERPARAMRIPLAAGFDPLLAYRIVCEARHWA